MADGWRDYGRHLLPAVLQLLELHRLRRARLPTGLPPDGRVDDGAGLLVAEQQGFPRVHQQLAPARHMATRGGRPATPGRQTDVRKSALCGPIIMPRADRRSGRSPAPAADLPGRPNTEG